MRAPLRHRYYSYFLSLLAVHLLWLCSCNTTRRLKDGEYLLRKNKLKVEVSESAGNTGSLTDGLDALIAQKPNKYAFGVFPYKLWLYNGRYRRYQRDTSAAQFQLSHSTVERPVVFDSLLMRRSAQSMKAFLYNSGYFYATIKDTVVYRQKKAYVTFNVNTGPFYAIRSVFMHVEDSAAGHLLRADSANTALKAGVPYTNTLIEEERIRLSDILRNEGYYRFSQEAITFKLDTVDKSFIQDADNPFENALRFVTLQGRQKSQPSLDVHVYVRATNDSTTFRRYGIGRVSIYPDFIDRNDLRDSSLYQSVVDSVSFRYHKYYVREKVILDHIYMQAGTLYRQSDYDRTITKLNELGLFQYVQVFLIEDSTLPRERSLRCAILLNPTQKYDFLTNFEVTSATTYKLGSALTFSLRNRNVFKGANQLSISLSGGIELTHLPDEKNPLLDYLSLLSRYAGINATLDFPKVLAPAGKKLFRKSNAPHTIVGLGTSILERVNYFTLINTTANFTYNWRQTFTKTWDFSPAFVNVQSLPRIAADFQARLDTNDFLRNTYREVFIEGENLSFTFNNAGVRRKGFSYSYLRASVEEAGGLVSGISAIGDAVANKLDIAYQNYFKIDVDARHFIPYYSSLLAMRFFAGIGLPYNGSVTLPYIKQYYVGGPYSIRGWRVRTLGPGSYYDSTNTVNAGFIDRTGDIKLEGNFEYRFDVVQLFSGSLKLGSAVFADAGNIWLANKSASYPDGDLSLERFGRDIAMSIGTGVRVDIGGLFILRFDFAAAIKKPYDPHPGGWVLRQLASYKGWWNDNLVTQIAIGYPF